MKEPDWEPMTASKGNTIERFMKYVAKQGYGCKELAKPGFLDEFCIKEPEIDKIDYNYLCDVID